MAVVPMLAAVSVLAAPGIDVPRLTGPVVDRAGLLNSSEQQVIGEALRTFQRDTTNQLQVLIVDSLDGAPIEEYSIRVVEAWKLGSRVRDNGVLLLVAVKDRQWRIEVGGGLEGDLPDALVARMGEEHLIPAFKDQAYAAGIASTLQAVASALGGELRFDGLKPSRSQRARGWGSWLYILFFILLVVFGGRRRGGLLGGLLLGSMLGGGYRGGRGGGGFGGGGGGGWSGGGGGFSGGGASGGW